jgi:hypothetical protein
MDRMIYIVTETVKTARFIDLEMPARFGHTARHLFQFHTRTHFNFFLLDTFLHRT